MPVPSCAPASCPRRLKGWNSCASLSAARPSPVSCRLMRVRSWAAAVQRTSTRPPTRLYLMALDSRLTSTCLTRVRSARTSQGPSSSGKCTRMPLWWACGSIMAWQSARTSASDMGSGDSDSLPDSMSARSRISLISVQQVPTGLQDLVDAVLLTGRGRRRAGLHQLGEAEDGVERRAQLVAHAGEELRLRQVRLLGRDLGLLQLQVAFLQHRVEALALGLHLLAGPVVGADQQVADDGVGRVLQRRHRHHGRQAAAVLADVGQLVDVLDAASRLEHQRLEARRDGRAPLDAQRQGARHQLLGVGNVRRRDAVQHFAGRVAEHALGTHVEDLDDTVLVGGDAGEVGAV